MVVFKALSDTFPLESVGVSLNFWSRYVGCQILDGWHDTTDSRLGRSYMLCVFRNLRLEQRPVEGRRHAGVCYINP